MPHFFVWLNKHLMVNFFFLFALFEYSIHLIKQIIHFTIYLFSGYIDRLFLSTFDCRYLVLIEKVKRIYRKQLSELIVLSTAETYQGQSHVAEAL